MTGRVGMRGSRLRQTVGILVASSLFVSSAGALAASSTSTIPQVNPWAALTAMSGSAPAAVFCGGAAAAAAAQAATGGCVLPQVDQPVATTAAPPQPTLVPVPPAEPAGAGLGIDPLILGLGALAAGALVYFLVIKKHHDHDESPA